MTARCRDCGTYWGVSIKQMIPKNGYHCPICEKTRKKPNLLRIGKAKTKNILSAV